MKIAFLGGLYPDNIGEIIKNSNSGLDFAADAYQRNYLKCISNKSGIDLTILNRLFLGSWPKNYKKIWINQSDSVGDYRTISIAYNNVLGIRDLSQKIRTIKRVEQWCNSFSTDDKLLFVYSSNFSNCLRSIKKKCKDLKVCLLIPDMPRYTYLSKQSLLRRIVLLYRQFVFEQSCKHTDLCVCITKEMKSYIENKTGAKCIVIEGIADKDRCQKNLLNVKQKGKRAKTIMYSGTLAERYGILDLIKAFRMLEHEDVELWICGRGDAEKDIKNVSIEDNRIKYFGSLPNERVKRMQEQCDILVNPRRPGEMFTSFSFPSKTLEYLESGNLVVSYHLEGIPSEYFDYIVTPSDVSVEALNGALRKCLLMDAKAIEKHRMSVLDFLISTKCESQINKVIENI